MLPRGASILEILDQRTIQMPNVEQTQQFLGEWTDYRGSVKTSDEGLQIRQNKAGELTLTTPTAKQKGGKYYLDAELLETAQSEFVSVGSIMRMTVPPEHSEAVLNLLINDRQYPLFADAGKDIAQARLGIVLPEFIAVEDLPVPEPESVPIPEEVPVKIAEDPIAASTTDHLVTASPEIFVQTDLFNQLGVGFEQPVSRISRVVPEIALPPRVEHHLESAAIAALSQADESYVADADGQVVAFIPTRVNDPIVAPEKFQAMVTDFRGFFDQGNLTDSMTTERFLFQELPIILDSNQDWQALKWSELADDQIQTELHQILQQAANQGSSEVQTLMQEHPIFADWLTEQIFQADRWELVYESAPDLLETELNNAQIVLSAAAKAYAFGADNDKVVANEHGAWVYPGQSFDISYVPISDTFLVQEKDGAIIAQSIGGEIDRDHLVDIPSEIVQRFDQLIRVMDERGVQPSTKTPKESCEQAMAAVQSVTVNQDELEHWQKQANEIGRSPGYLQRLSTTIETAQQSGFLPEAAHKARLTDQQQWQSQLEKVVQQTRSILHVQGVPMANGKGIVGKIYRIHQSHDGRITINTKDRGEILRVEADGSTTSSVTKADADRFTQQMQFLQAQAHPTKAPAMQR